MLGTIVNTIAIVAGGCAGLLIKGGLKDRYKQIIMQAISLSVLFLGASSSLTGLMSGDAEPILFIASLVIGSGIGEFIDIESKLQTLGDFIQSKVGGNNIAQGFVAASLVYCVGTMAILGSLESGINHNHTTLYVKSVLDGVSAIIFTSTLGLGVIFSGISVFIYQGLLTLFASFLQPYLTADMLREINIVGGILIFSIGINLLEVIKIKVGNMLPAIIIPALYYLPPVQAIFETASSWF